MPDALRHLTLDNGLQLVLRHAPRLKRGAAALRVSAGSHDAPTAWPGLAHFLEHLFFLGTARFPLEDGLMRYVQGLGGQVNASTRERTTDFFFEVPPAGLAGGLERLCQMLAEPDLDLERQRREREVIHAEFIAWSRNPEAQRQFALLQAVSPRHPLSGFHAGNRYSLAVQNPGFQRALHGFHRRFYQAAQMTLSLCGPQPLDELEGLGRQYGSLFATGSKVEQEAPPALLNVPQRLPKHAPQLDLLFAHQALPAGAEQALELLIAWLSDSRPGGWLGELRQRGWLQDFSTQVLYAFAGQALWHVQLQLNASASREEVRDLLHGWLGFMRQTDAEYLNAEFARLQHCREQAASALVLARRDSSGHPFQALDEQGLKALRALIDSLPASDSGQWQLPPADPLLMAVLPGKGHAPLPAGLKRNGSLPATRQCGALYLRWQINSPLRQRFQAILERTMQPLMERAERASVQLHFSASGDAWQLRCTGLPAAVIRVSEQALALLRTPPLENWPLLPSHEPVLIPIRALLKQLPDAILAVDPEPQPACTLDQDLLDALWQHATWQGLVVGFSEAELHALGSVLQALPGQPASSPTPSLLPGRRWQQATVPGSEQALLLFCPLPASAQGSGRLLAQLLQGPFYQRLRVELQLGYAVFSAFRQIEGRSGLLFGVQSPSATHGEILAHLQTLLQASVKLEPSVRQALAAQFDEAAMDNAQVAEWAWQTQLATQAEDLADLQRAILATGQTDLDDLLQHLLNAEWGWLCLANGPPPDASWQ
ncbi:pyrroloquinoline quinone biosynthesis protein PqqF [Pseudomonas sp. X10]